jgi:nicotinate-nucleotide adenylyltransferase
MSRKRISDRRPGAVPAEGPTRGRAEVTDSAAGEASQARSRGLAVGMFGGSFDPIHEGHLHAARAARDAFGLDRVVFVPARQPPHKPGRRLAPGADRIEMIRRAIRGERGFEVSDLELGREGPSFTVDTLHALREPWRVPGGEQPRLFLILGSDNLPDLPAWHLADEILALAQPIVVLRAEDPIPGRAWFDAIPEPARSRIERGILRLPPVAGRSTELRAALSRGELARRSLPKSVRDYIRERHLYAAEPPA